MTIEDMRYHVENHPKYRDSPRWRDRVRRMPDEQVFAIYEKFKLEDYRKIEREMKETKKSNDQFHQMDIFEYMEGK